MALRSSRLEKKTMSHQTEFFPRHEGSTEPAVLPIPIRSADLGLDQGMTFAGLFHFEEGNLLKRLKAVSTSRGMPKRTHTLSLQGIFQWKPILLRAAWLFRQATCSGS